MSNKLEKKNGVKKSPQNLADFCLFPTNLCQAPVFLGSVHSDTQTNNDNNDNGSQYLCSGSCPPTPHPPPLKLRNSSIFFLLLQTARKISFLHMLLHMLIFDQRQIFFYIHLKGWGNYTWPDRIGSLRIYSVWFLSCLDWICVSWARGVRGFPFGSLCKYKQRDHDLVWMENSQSIWFGPVLFMCFYCLGQLLPAGHW